MPLPSAGIKGVHYYAWLEVFLFLFCSNLTPSHTHTLLFFLCVQRQGLITQLGLRLTITKDDFEIVLTNSF